jgi:uncharacterized membrane-anchored protein YhcB (DUF1043 family)
MTFLLTLTATAVGTLLGNLTLLLVVGALAQRQQTKQLKELQKMQNDFLQLRQQEVEKLRQKEIERLRNYAKMES